MPSATAENLTRVLVVDDDNVSLTILRGHLARRGFDCMAAKSVAEAKSVLLRDGPGEFSAVISDYNMPGATGLELLAWLREQDDSLAAVIVTADPQRKLAADSMRVGAVDFVEKPVRVPELLQAVERAVGSTRRRRDLRLAKSAMREIAVVQHALLKLQVGAFPDRLDVVFHPKQDAGGDLAAVFPLGPDRLILLVSDVSGHDVKAAFVASYFQGVARGMIERAAGIDDVFAVFNRFLLEEWNRPGNWHDGSTVETSVAACALEIDFARKELRILNCGSPAPRLVRSAGPAGAPVAAVQSPLGWFPDLTMRSAPEDWPGDRVILWTDGLEDLATERGVDPMALAVSLRRARHAGVVPDYLGDAKDDVLAIVLDLSDSPGAAAPAREILIHQALAGDSGALVDELQETWSRSLALVLPELGEMRHFDILLATRETVLNALLHGCMARPDRQAILQVEWWPAAGKVVVRVTDPGAGIASTSPAADLANVEPHRGLALIAGLADEIRKERGGADVTLTFNLNDTDHA